MVTMAVTLRVGRPRASTRRYVMTLRHLYGDITAEQCREATDRALTLGERAESSQARLYGLAKRKGFDALVQACLPWRSVVTLRAEVADCAALARQVESLAIALAREAGG